MIGAVPAMLTCSPTTTAREKPTVGSYGEPEEIRRRSTREMLPLTGEEDAERCAAAGAILDPGPAAVQLGESGHERQADADSGPVGILDATLAEGLEDRCPLVLWDARAHILHADERATLLRADPHPDRRAGRRVTNRVRQDVLDDPLDRRRVDRDGQHT